MKMDPMLKMASSAIIFSEDMFAILGALTQDVKGSSDLEILNPELIVHQIPQWSSNPSFEDVFDPPIEHPPKHLS